MKIASTSRIATRPARPGWWTFSLRTLLVTMTLIGILLAAIFAPVLHEVRLANEITRSVGELEKENPTPSKFLRDSSQDISWRLTPRKHSYALWLAQRLWPGQVPNLGQEIAALQVNPGAVRDLAKMPDISSVTEWRFAYATAVCANPHFRQTRITSISYEQANALDPPRDPDIHLLSHFPNVETVCILRVPADTHALDDLRSCRKLRRLELALDARWIDKDRKRFVLPLETAPLQGLQQLEELQIHRLPPEVDWSFLADMKALRSVEINPLGTSTPGGVYAISDRLPVVPREATPLFQLARLQNLRRVDLQCTPAYAADLALLVRNSPVEQLQLEHVPEGPTALAVLRDAKSLRRLHLVFSQFADLAALQAELQQLPQLREMSCEFQELTDAHVRLLAQLKQIESLQITYVDEYRAGAAGRATLAALPLHVFQTSYEWSSPGSPPSDAEKLAMLAAQKRRARNGTDEPP